MRIIHWITLGLVIVLATWFVIRTQDKQARKEVTLDLNWKFSMGEHEHAKDPVFNDKEWEFVSIPHDWMIRQKVNKNNPSGTAGGFYPGGIAWYRKSLDLSDFDHLSHFYLLFEGVQSNADIWFNGEYLGHQQYGYSSFYYDLDELIRTDTLNVIAVRIDCSKLPIDRWYPGSGIYRDVKLIGTQDIHVPVWGESASSMIDSMGNASLNIGLDLKNSYRKSRRFEIRYDVVSPNGKLVAEGKSSEHLEGHSTDTRHKEFIIEDPILWSPENSELYTIHCYLMEQNRIIDRVSMKHGFRSVEFTPEQGLLLNGEKYVMKGVNLHHDGGNLGSAVPVEVWRRRLSILKQLGVNSLRLAHNPHAPEVLDLCDEMGFLVIDEAFDKWELPWKSCSEDYSFEENWERDLENFIRRDRSHASVILWSVGNETVEQFDDVEGGIEWYRKLIRKTRELDPTREVTAAMRPGRPGLDVEWFSSLAAESRIVSYNYRSDSIKSWHERYPNLVFIVSETKAYATNKPEDYQEIDFSDNAWLDMEEYMVGQFVWAGIDYLGESAGWPDRGFRHGLLETNGFVKPHAWFLASHYRTDPLVKIAVKDSILAEAYNNETSWQVSWSGAPLVDHWSFQNEPSDKDVVIFTNCEKVELHLNSDTVLTAKKSEFEDGVIKFRVPFIEGELIAKAFYVDERGGLTTVSDTLRTSYEPWALAMHPDRRVVDKDNRIVHITTSVVDSLGEANPHANHMVTYELDGPGEILIIDNGDLGKQLPYGTNKARLKKGKQLLILHAGSEPGDLIVSASADGLRSSTVKIKSKD